VAASSHAASDHAALPNIPKTRAPVVISQIDLFAFYGDGHQPWQRPLLGYDFAQSICEQCLIHFGMTEKAMNKSILTHLLDFKKDVREI